MGRSSRARAGDAVRAAMCRYVRANPGAHFRDVQRSLGLGPGQTSHHLRVLLGQGVLAERRMGRYAHYFAAGTPSLARPQLAATRHPARRALAEALRDESLTFRELVAECGLAPSTLHHHLRVLRTQGVVNATGARPRLYILVDAAAPGAAHLEAPAPAAVAA
jgi:DNA-binding transcriptional ArsR family regulator